MYLTLFLLFIAVTLLGVCCAVVLRRSGEMYLPKAEQAPEPKDAMCPPSEAAREDATAKRCCWSLDRNDPMPTNPATGLPMIGGISGFDASGNSYGWSGRSLFDD